MTMLLLLCSMVACASALIHNDCVADVSSRCKAAALPVKCADWVNTVTDPEYDKFHEFGASKARVADAVRNLLQKLCVYTKLETKSLTFALFTLLAPPQCKAIFASSRWLLQSWCVTSRVGHSQFLWVVSVLTPWIILG